MRKSFALIVNILATLVVIGILYYALMKANFSTSLQNNDTPPEFKNSTPSAVVEKSKAVASAVNDVAKARNKDIDDALGN